MNLQTFFLRAGLATVGAGVAGYAGLAMLLPARLAAPPAVSTAAVTPAPAVAIPVATSVAAPAGRPAIAAAGPAAAARPESVRPGGLTRAPSAASSVASPLLPALAPLPPNGGPRPARHLAEPRSARATHAVDVNAAVARPAEHPRPLPRPVHVEAAPSQPAYQVYYPVPTDTYAGRSWTYRRVY